MNLLTHYVRSAKARSLILCPLPSKANTTIKKKHTLIPLSVITLLSILIAGCPGFNNRLQCENGYKVDRNGCPISECGMYETMLSTQ